MAQHTEKVGLGGGCHWCTEAVFQPLRGVSHVTQGFIRSDAPDDGWSEAVLVSFDMSVIPLEVLIEIHLRTHSSNSSHKMRGKYRSAVYVFDEVQGERVRNILDSLKTSDSLGQVTRVLSYCDFKASDERFHNYYQNGPERPFCKRYIDPKLDLLRKDYADYLSA